MKRKAIIKNRNKQNVEIIKPKINIKVKNSNSIKDIFNCSKKLILVNLKGEMIYCEYDNLFNTIQIYETRQADMVSLNKVRYTINSTLTYEELKKISRTRPFYNCETSDNDIVFEIFSQYHWSNNNMQHTIIFDNISMIYDATNAISSRTSLLASNFATLPILWQRNQ